MKCGGGDYNKNEDNYHRFGPDLPKMNDDSYMLAEAEVNKFVFIIFMFCVGGNINTV